jgi:large subunit ribosomal protein L31
MKANIHPQYFENAQVICVCGNRFTTGSTQEVIHIELCDKCHPFFTGEQRFVDTRNAIKNFDLKRQAAATYQATKKKKTDDKKKADQSPKSLREMLMGMK